MVEAKATTREPNTQQSTHQRHTQGIQGSNRDK